MDERAYWIGFNTVKGIGAVRLKLLLDYFGDAKTAWQAPIDGLLAAGLTRKIAENVLATRAALDLPSLIDRIEAGGYRVLILGDAEYPRRLKEIQQAPPVLFLSGEILAEDEWAVSIVGTRRVSEYGVQVTAEIATFLAQNRVTVVSGLARGVDSAAHKAALRAGGRTFAVLGSGVDQIYPPENKQLAGQIRQKGALLSDYALGTPPDGVNFPPRNRIISGLSLATVIIEAGNKSGALITASFAAEQGREVFAVPGGIYAVQSKGTNDLIRQGARPLLHPQEILDALNIEKIHEYQAAARILPNDPDEAQLYQYLSMEPLHIDEICRAAGLKIDKVSATLAMMELKGIIRNVGGMSYVSVRESGENYRRDHYV